MSAKIGSVKAKLRPVVEGAPRDWHVTSTKANLRVTLHSKVPCKALTAKQCTETLHKMAHTAQQSSHDFQGLAEVCTASAVLLCFTCKCLVAQAFVKRAERTWAAYVISLLSRLLVELCVSEPSLCKKSWLKALQ